MSKLTVKIRYNDNEKGKGKKINKTKKNDKNDQNDLKALTKTVEKSKLTIKILYADHEIDKIKKIDKGDWIDLRAAETVEMKAGDFASISLGVAMEIPEGYEAHLVTRSSTFKKYHVIQEYHVVQTNGVGIIDNSYKGDNDIWRLPVYATQDTIIKKNERIAQFRIMEKMPEVELVEVETLGNDDRGGFGSTGTV